MHTSDDSCRSRKQRPPRLNHKKSKNGCARCKARRVKCDEGRPKCGGCERHDVPCQYPSSLPAMPNCTAEKEAPGTRTGTIGFEEENPVTSFELSESRARRLLELRLLHHFTTSTSQTLPGADHGNVRETWAVHIPQLALKHNPLLYSILAVSALHMSKLDPTNQEHVEVYNRYSIIALREHTTAISLLNPKTADAVCISCILICKLAFNAIPSNNALGPENSPLQSFLFSYGSGQVLQTALKWIKDDPTSKAAVIVKSSPHAKEACAGDVLSFDPEVRRLVYPREYGQQFSHLLHQGPAVREGEGMKELWNTNIERVYQDTLSYIGSIQKGINAQESQGTICRRIMGFSKIIPGQFMQLVKERQPRALVVLAHFFALTKRLEDIWWVKDMAGREVVAVYDMLPVEWRPFLQGPLQIISDQRADMSGRIQN